MQPVASGDLWLYPAVPNGNGCVSIGLRKVKIYRHNSHVVNQRVA